MSEPLAFLPFALAAGGGGIDGFNAAPLVAAGVTLLQRAAPLVRALDGRRSAILLRSSAHALVALAASIGRGALMVDPRAARADIHAQLTAAQVGAVFTCDRHRECVPGDIPVVLLDDAPRVARVYAQPGDRMWTVDLGAHHGLSLEGSRHVDGVDDECVHFAATAQRAAVSLSHRAVLAAGHGAGRAWSLTPRDRVLVLLPFRSLAERVTAESAVLLTGGQVMCPPRFRPREIAATLEQDGVTGLVASEAVFSALVREPSALAACGALRFARVVGDRLPADVVTRFASRTGIAVQGFTDRPSPRD